MQRDAEKDKREKGRGRKREFLTAQETGTTIQTQKASFGSKTSKVVIRKQVTEPKQNASKAVEHGFNMPDPEFW